MKRRYILPFLAVLAAGLFLFPRSSHRVPQEQLPPQRELALKQTLLQQDVRRTDELCRSQCALDFHESLSRLQGGAQSIPSALDIMRKEHPHMLQLIWHPLNKQDPDIVSGNASSVVKDGVQSALSEARRATEAGREYQSRPLSIQGETYFVLGVPSSDQRHSLLGIIHQRILNKVASHQQKNLRIVPYPGDHNWKIESVDSNTLQDVKVDHPEQNEGTSHYHKNEVVVKFKQPPSGAELRQIQKEIGADSVRKVGYTYVFTSKQMEAKQLMSYFRQKHVVEYAEPHFLYLTNTIVPPVPRADTGTVRSSSEQASITPNDKLYAKYQWNLPMIDTNLGWTISKGAKDVIVGIVDTGVDLTHPDLSDHLIPGYNIVDDNTRPQDDVGHGTHVAGVISAIVNNNRGVAGMTWMNPVMPVKVLDSSGAGSTYAVARGIIWATDHGAKVINMSLGNYADANFLHDAIKYAFDHDVVLIAASGNDNTDKPGYPAAYPEVLAVAATDANKNKAPFSNYGDYIDVAAPGVNIASTFPDNQYAALSGTSMASPHVTALAALIRSANPSLKNTEVMDIIRQSAQDLGPNGKDPYYGYGQIDVENALRLALGQHIEKASPGSFWSQWLARLGLR